MVVVASVPLEHAQREAAPIERRAPGEAMTAGEVEAIDEAWRQLGFESRTAMREIAIARLGLRHLNPGPLAAPRGRGPCGM